MPRPSKTHLNTKSLSSKPMQELNGSMAAPEGTPSVNETVASAPTSAAPDAPFSTAKGGGKPMQEAHGNGRPEGTALPSAARGGMTTRATEPSHQTHGAVLPIRGPISSVAELLGRNVAEGSLGSFASMEDYRAYLNGLTLHQLHQHAVNEAKIVPIDDRTRLTKRLESEYTTVASKAPGRRALPPPPKPYTQEQLRVLDEVQKRLLRR